MSSKSVQAPSLGINQYDSYDDMKAGYALILDNWIAEPGRCRLRRGSQTLNNHSSSIETIMSYGDELIVAAGGKLIEAGLTYTGGMPAVGSPTDLATGYSSDSWDWVVFNDKLICVNGTDTPQVYDGATVVNITDSSAVNPEDFIGVRVFKGRCLYWKDEAAFYYCAAGSYQGTFTQFDLSLWVSKKARLKLIFTWSSDAGDGADDYAVFLMSTGEALVYQGSDPASTTDWALVGTYSMGEPVALRGSASLAGDEVILTRLGWQNFGVVWNGGDLKDEGIGKYVAGLAAEATEEYGIFTGWEAHFYPEYRMLLINVPQGAGTAIQHIMQTNTNGWSTFSGWNATTFGNFNGQIVYGTSGGDLRIAMIGFDDDGEPIYGDSVPAFDYLGTRATNKLQTAVRAITTLDDPAAVEVVGCADFVTPDSPVLTVTPAPFEAAEWGDPWGTPWTTRGRLEARGWWRNTMAHGYAHSYRLRLAAVGRDVFWFSSQIMFDRAGEV